jgi:hypothetical protein
MVSPLTPADGLPAASLVAWLERLFAIAAEPPGVTVPHPFDDITQLPNKVG